MPDWNSPLAARLAPLALRPAREREIIDELSQHLEDRYEELRRDGMSHDDAMRLAIEEINDEGLLAREMRVLKQSSAPSPLPPGPPSGGWLADAWQDLRYASRMLARTPGFTIAAVLTLALGIGANTAIFSLVNATLLQHLPVANRDRLSYVFNGPQRLVTSYPAYVDLRDSARLLDGVAAWGGIAASLNADGETDTVMGCIVTGNFFDVLGVSAERGRLLGVNDDVTPGGHPVAVISHRLWQGRFAGRSDIVGAQIRLNGGLHSGRCHTAGVPGTESQRSARSVCTDDDAGAHATASRRVFRRDESRSAQESQQRLAVLGGVAQGGRHASPG